MSQTKDREAIQPFMTSNRMYVGTPGFSYPDWHGTFYPSDFKKQKMHELQFLAEFFDFCEINSSFYRPVNPEYAYKWCQYVSNNETFSIHCGAQRRLEGRRLAEGERELLPAIAGN